MQFIKNLWNKLPDNAKIRIISISKTFASTLILALAAGLLSTHQLEWTVAFWGGLLSAAIREALNAIVAPFVSQRLGGKKIE